MHFERDFNFTAIKETKQKGVCTKGGGKKKKNAIKKKKWGGGGSALSPVQ